MAPKENAGHQRIGVAHDLHSGFPSARSANLLLDHCFGESQARGLPIAQGKDVGPLSLAADLQPCGFPQELGPRARLPLGLRIDVGEQRILKGDIHRDIAHSTTPLSVFTIQVLYVSCQADELEPH